MTRIRTAGAADLAALDAVRVRSWSAAYRGLVPDEVLAGLAAGAGRERRLAAMAQRLAGAGQVALLAERAEAVVGMVLAGPERPTVAAAAGAPRRGEVYALYTVPEVWSTGTGRALLAAAEAELAASGYAAAVLWVLAGNARARRCYERQGWAASGVRQDVVIGGVSLPELEYGRSLKPVPPSAAPGR